MSEIIKLPTLEELIEQGKDVEAVIQQLDALRMKQPSFVPKPNEPKKLGYNERDSVEIREYAESIIKYGNELLECAAKEEANEIEKRNVSAFNGKISSLQEEYIKHASGLNDLPFNEDIKNRIYYIASEYGSGDGYCGTYWKLSELIPIFKDAANSEKEQLLS